MRKPVLILLALTAPAAAQNPPPANDVEVPTVVIETGEQASAASDESLDLANVVQSAAKGVTTVQEAPAIVTVVTSDEIKDRQYQTIDELMDNVPGWQQDGLANSFFVTPLVRGQVQAVQFLKDGLSMFDPFPNMAAITRVQPMELVKRVELITGPGGVLWGSNSLLGILNIITKDAEDVDGVEVGATLGSGPGDRGMGRAYAMFGKSDMAGGKLKIFGHGSVETFQGDQTTMPLLLFHDPLPQPNSPNTYGGLASANEARSLLVNLDAKLTYDKFVLRMSFPFGSNERPLPLSGNPTQDVANPNDPNNTARHNQWDTFDRYAVGEYRTRFAHDKAGITARGYFIQFDRGLHPLQVVHPWAGLVGGLVFDTNMTSYRSGAAIDGDVEVTRSLRVLYGGEAFREWKITNTTGSIQGTGSQADFSAPADLTRLPLPCPSIYDPNVGRPVPVPGCPLTFAYDQTRTVAGAYVDPQFRPTKTLIFDAGARIQAAPEALGSLSYPLTTTVGGAVVWNFIPNWHLKLNYTEGFRPPVFNNTAANGEAVVIAGNPDLKVETSNATQAEVNARIFKGERRIRELSFRVDGSYTQLQNLIQVQAGSYRNTADRGIASAEFLGKLYIQGGHRIELGYTWLQVNTQDKGVIRSLPNHWFNLSTVWNLVSSKLSATTNLRVMGAMEDPNRLVEYRGLTLDAMGDPNALVNVKATDVVMDRLPPIAELSGGVTYTPTSKFSLRATVYNALYGHTYYPDAFYDYEPHLEYLPNPRPGFRAYLSAMYQY